MPKTSQERREDMSFLIIEEIRLKSYLENFHSKHVAFKADVARRGGEYYTLEARYKSLAEEGARERNGVRKEEDKVQKRAIQTEESIRAAEESLKMLRLQLTDWEIRTQISQAKVDYVCGSIEDDKKNLGLLAQQMLAEAAKLRADTGRVDATGEAEAGKADSLVRLCGIVEENLELVHKRWLAIWPLLSLWQRAAKVGGLSDAPCCTLQGLSAETAALRACMARIERLPPMGHSEADYRAYAQADGDGDIVSAPLRSLCAELHADLADARSRTESLRALLPRLQERQKQGSEALASLRRAVDGDLGATTSKVQAEIERAVGCGGLVGLLKASATLLTESDVQSPVGSQSWRWYREVKICPSLQMNAVYSSARAESTEQLEAALLAEAGADISSSSPASTISRLKTIVGSLQLRERSVALQAAVECAYIEAARSTQELVEMVTSEEGGPAAAVASYDTLKTSLSDAKAILFDFKLLCLLSSQLSWAIGLLPPEAPRTLSERLSRVLQYVRARRDAGDSRPQHRHDISENVADLTYSARHASLGFKDAAAADDEVVEVTESAGSAADAKAEARLARKSERRNRSTLFSTLFRSSVVLPPEDVARYLAREDGARLISTSMTRVNGVIAQLTFFFNDATDVLKVHAAIAPDVNYFLFISHAQSQEFFADEPGMGNLPPDSVDACHALTRRLSIETYSTSFVQRLLGLCRDVGMKKACVDVEPPNPASNSYAPCALLCLRTRERRKLFAFGLPGQLSIASG